MMLNNDVLTKSEKIIFSLRELYSSFGYLPYRMSKFEEYDVYAQNKDFLVSDNVITFTDTDGKLMALKPDVTLSIIKNSIDNPEIVKKVFYNENVYRVSDGTGSFKEIMQAGVECFGNVCNQEICDTIILAAESLKMISDASLITLSDLDILDSIVKKLKLDNGKLKMLYKAIGEKNVSEIENICTECVNKSAVVTLKKLVLISGKPNEVIPEIKSIISQNNCNLFKIIEKLNKNGVTDIIRVDFSLTGDINYYNGIVFKGFIRDIPTPVLSGGQYDKLMKKLGKKSRAIGFAVYTDFLETINFATVNAENDDIYVNVALPKGRLGEKIYKIFADAGFECPEILEPNRKLIFENPQKNIRYFWVKPSDVAIYVERGAADIGVAGKDILLEYEPDVYELCDLKKGVCKMAVAAPKNFKDNMSETLRVATKFVNITKNYYRTKGRNIDIIRLNGSIEIAPILKLSDVIVDIVETGATLKENNLEVIEDVIPISARLIANKSSYKFKKELIENIAEAISSITEV